MLVVVGAFTSVHQAELARSVLEAAGIETVLADEHVVSMHWMYSNAIGGVKVLVSEERLDEARTVLESRAEDVDPPTMPEKGGPAGETCERCGASDFGSRLSFGAIAAVSWIALGIPLGFPKRRRYCRQCGASAPDDAPIEGRRPEPI